MRHIHLIIIFVFLTIKTRAVPLMDSVVSTTTVAKYSKFEVLVQATAIDPQTINPYNSSEVDMYAIFTSPGGKEYSRDAFWYREYSRCNTCINPTTQGLQDTCGSFNEVPEIYPPNANAYLTDQNTIFPWRVRFAPDATGTWTYIVVAHLPGSGQSDTSAPQFHQIIRENMQPKNRFLKV